MIKRLVVIFLLLVLLVWAGLKLQGQAGFVMISTLGWRFEMPLWFAALSLVSLLLLTHLGGALWRRVRGIKRYWQAWRLERQQKQQAQQSLNGFLALAEGNWAVAERALIRTAEKVMTPFSHYVGAARAAFAQHAPERAQRYLNTAQTKTPGSELAIQLSQVHLLVTEHHFEEARSLAEALCERYPKQTQLLTLLKTIYIQLEDWGALADLLPELKRQHVIAEPLLNRLEIQCYQAALQQAASDALAQMHQVWHCLPTALQRKAELVLAYAQGLIQQGADEYAEEVLRAALKRQWDNDLIALYGQLRCQDPKKLLAQAQKWLKVHAHNAALLVCLGRLALQCDLWKEAQSYLAEARSKHATPVCDYYLGVAYEQLGQHKEAQLYFRQAAEVGLS